MRRRVTRWIAAIMIGTMLVSSVQVGTLKAEGNNTVVTEENQSDVSQEPQSPSDSETNNTGGEVLPENPDVNVDDNSDANSENTDSTDTEILEEVQIPEKTEQSEEDTEIEETIEEVEGIEAALNYLYINEAEQEEGAVQNIVLSWGNSESNVKSASIIVENESGNVTTLEPINRVSETFLYEHIFSKGIYHVSKVNIETETSTKEFAMEELGISANFGVGQSSNEAEKSEYIEMESVNTSGESGGNVEASIVSIDENGEATAQDTISAAMAAQGVGKSSANKKMRSAKASNVVVVLDPGHDSTHAGARGNGVEEEVAVLKIAQYCKAELEQYNGVTVYMTRTGAACPFPNSTSNIDDIYKRTAWAKTKGANVFVSFHLNSSGSSAAKGAEVYYCSSSSAGKVLAQQIQNQLVALGLTNRGIKVNDEFAVIKGSNNNGFPGLIIEHAFLSNSSDANSYLKSEASLKSLGVADATGIAKYFGLSKGPYLELDTHNYVNLVGQTYTLLAKTRDTNTKPTVTVGDSSIVSVKEIGKDSRGYLYTIQGLKAGSTTITVKQNGLEDAMKVKYVTPGDYTLDTSKLALDIGGTYTLLAKVEDKIGAAPTVKSSDTSVATAKLLSTTDSRGYLFAINGLKTGNATITVTYQGIEKTMEVTVKNNLVLDTHNYSSTVGKTYTLLAKTKDTQTKPTVTIGDSSIVSVKEAGKDNRGYLYTIKGLKEGKTSITVTQGTVKDTLDVTYKNGADYTLDTSKLTLDVGGTYTLLAKVTDKVDEALTIKSSDTSVAAAKLLSTTDSRGYLFAINGLKTGNATITVTYQGVEKTMEVTVKNNLVLDTHNYSSTVGKTYMLLAKTKDIQTKPTVTIGDSSIVSVKEAGKDNRGYLYTIKGLKEGKTSITVTQGTVQDTLNVTYKSYTLDTSKLTLDVGGAYTLLAKVEDKIGAAPTVKSSDTSVAAAKLLSTTDSRGYLFTINGLKTGNATITVTYQGIEKTMEVTVKNNLVLDTHNYSSTVGKTYTLLAKTKDIQTKPTVTIGDSSIVSVEEAGKDNRGYLYTIKGLKEGKTSITVTQGTVKDTLDVTYKNGADYTLDTSKLTLDVGGTYTLLAKVADKIGAAPTVKSSDISVAAAKLLSTTDSRGYLFTINGLKTGNATITVTYQGIEKTMEVTVKNNLVLDTHNYSSTVGKTYTLLAKTKDIQTKPTVTIGDSSIVSVEEAGKDNRGYLYTIKGLKEGKTSITVTQGTVQDTLNVTYKSGADYTLDTSKLTLDVGGTYTLLAKVADKIGAVPTVKSSDTSVATAKLLSTTDSRGYLFTINGLKTGNATITVTYQGIEKTMEVTVKNNLVLDTHNYSSTVGKTYMFLAKTKDTQTKPTVTIGDSSIVSVEEAGKDNRGYLYTIKGLKEGKTSITVTQGTVQDTLNVIYEKYDYIVDTSKVSIAHGKAYDFLIKGDMPISAISVSTSDSEIIRCSLQNGSDSRGYLYRIFAVGEGNASVTINCYGVIKKIDVIVTKANLYEISGESGYTSADLVKLYKKTATYPSFYKASDAPTLEMFCQIYYEEAKAENIKPEVAFCQAMLETNWLRFGGDVKIEQYNFAGIGATGNGAPGNSFKSVREGIRAQVQHLKAYAVKGITEKDLAYSCVDPRFKWVNKGCAPYVEWLGIKENPSGTGWAGSENYGYIILDIIKRL